MPTCFCFGWKLSGSESSPYLFFVTYRWNHGIHIAYDVSTTVVNGYCMVMVIVGAFKNYVTHSRSKGRGHSQCDTYSECCVDKGRVGSNVALCYTRHLHSSDSTCYHVLLLCCCAFSGLLVYFVNVDCRCWPVRPCSNYNGHVS